MARKFKAPQSIKNYIHGVRTVHLCVGLPFDHHKQFDFSLVFRGIARVSKHVVKKALPITPEILSNIKIQLNLCDPSDATYWCLFVLGFLLMARKSNLVPPSALAFDPSKHLCRGDIYFNATGLFVKFKWSKTNQNSERNVVIPLLQAPQSPLCPLFAFKNMIRLVPAHPGSPVFLKSSGNSLVPLTHADLVSRLRFLLGKIGPNAENFSGHSFRRGGASWAFKAGVPGELIMLHGDWRSNAYLEYLERDLKTRCSVSLLMLNI